MFILEVSYGCPSEKYSTNGNFQWDQAKALKDLGHKIVFLAMDMRSIRRIRRFGVNEFVKDDIPVLEFNVPFGPYFYDLKSKTEKFLFEKGLRRIIKKYGKPDLVHVHFGETARCVVDACIKCKIPYVVTEHSSGISKVEIDSKSYLQLKKVYDNAAKVISVSSFLKTDLLEKFFVDSEIVHNIVDTEVFKILNKDQNKGDIFQMVSSGNLIERKGFDVLLRAYAEFIKGNPKSLLLIMGDGPEKENLINLSKHLGIEHYVKFSGKYTRKEFSSELQNSDVFVLASRHETFGVVYVEALANGVPVIATSCNGPEDFVNDDCGIIVPVDDVGKLARAMQNIKENIDCYNSVKIAEYTKNKFSSQIIAKQIINVFEEVLNG